MSSKEKIEKAAIYQVLHDYALQYKRYPILTIFSALCPALWSILIFFVPPLIIARIVNEFTQNNDIGLSSYSLLITLFWLSWFLGEMLWRLGLHTLIQLETQGIKNLSINSFHELIQRDYNFFINHFAGTLQKKTSTYARNFEKFSDVLAFNVINYLFQIIFASIILWQYSPIIPIFLIICLIVVINIAIPIIRKRMVLIAERHDAISKTLWFLSDAISNILTIKSFSGEVSEEKKYKTYIDDWTTKWKKASDYQNQRFDMVISPLYVATNVLWLILSLYFVQKLGLTVGTIVVIYSYFALVTRSFWEINRIYREIESCISESAEFTQLNLTPPAILDTKNASSLIVKKWLIQFESVYFSYSETEKSEMFLRDFNLTIAHNQKVWLVWPSGGWKTTITKLLLRFLDIDSGSISIDEQDIKDVTQSSLRNHIGYVPQEPLLFHQSLFDNIAYGNKNASRDEVMQSAKLAYADEFIQNLPQKYDTIVGERGIKLSGWQRQRIAIARAILKNAPILILDEATSALDSESEKYIQKWLTELMKNKTAIVVAHRLSTIKNLDRILVLSDGKIVQDGTHDQLIKKTWLYATLWGHQSGEFLADE